LSGGLVLKGFGKTLRATYLRVSLSRSLADARNTQALKNGLVVKNLLSNCLGGFGPEMVSPAQGRRPSHLGVEESMIQKEKPKEGSLPSSYSVPRALRLDMTGMSLGLTAMVNVLRVNYIGIVMQIQLPGIE